MVTVEEVKAILDDTQLTDSVITQFIIGADALVTSLLGETSLGPSLLEEIERYLTAHLISITIERMAKKEGAGGAFIEYGGLLGEGFEASTYGQTAVLLDITGTLASLGKNNDKIYAKIYAVKGYTR